MTATIFTYPPDYAMAAMAGRALRRLGVRVLLAIDRKAPKPVVEGCEVITTSFPRRHNLNGKPCVEGILATLEEYADGDPYQLKVDSDTLVRSLAWLDGRTEPAVGLSHIDGRSFFGACYALRTERLAEYRAAASRLHPSGSYPEDITIGELLPGIFTYENRALGCPYAGYSWESPRTPEQWREYQVLVFQRWEGKGRQDIKAAMKEFSA